MSKIKITHKTGSYRWNPSKWLSNEMRHSMSAADRGVYRDLIDWGHIHDGLPSDRRSMWSLSGCDSDREFKKIWKSIAPFFELRDGRYYPKEGNPSKATSRRQRDKRRHSITPKQRFKILERDGYKCRYCGVGIETCPLDIDHVLPVTQGGTNNPSNLVAACSTCNTGKGASLIRGGNA